MLDHALPSTRQSPKMSSRLLSSFVGSKTDLKIVLQSKRKVYSTLDRLQGLLIIKPSNNLSFDDINIDFIGTSCTQVERLTAATPVTGRSQAFHQFLRLSQPGLTDYYPEDRVLRAGQEYKIPFVFVIPQQLLPRVCTHSVDNETIREAHLQLPPSLGDCESQKSLDDFAPEMASIRYGIYAKISKDKTEGNTQRRVTVVAKARKVRIVPAVDEQPPLDVEGNEDYAMRKEKRLRKGLLKGKLGTLVMETEQPSSFRLPAPDSADETSRTTTMATVLLRFDPAEANAQPPRLGTLQSKLKVNTFYSTSARRTLPVRSDTLSELAAGFHSDTVDLSSRCMANVDWTRVDPNASSPEEGLRRSSSSVSGPLVPPSASVNYANGPYYAARILVPIELPQNKAFPPTFHSCLISRTYSIVMALSTQTGPSLSGTIDLRVPVQVSASPSLRRDQSRPSVASSIGSEGAVEDSEEENELGIDEFFEPRTLSVPEDDYVGGSNLRSSNAGLEQGSPRVTASGGVEAGRRDSLFAEQHNGLPEYSLFAPGARDRRIGVSAF